MIYEVRKSELEDGTMGACPFNNWMDDECCLVKVPHLQETETGLSCICQNSRFSHLSELPVLAFVKTPGSHICQNCRFLHLSKLPVLTFARTESSAIWHLSKLLILTFVRVSVIRCLIISVCRWRRGGEVKR